MSGSAKPALDRAELQQRLQEFVGAELGRPLVGPDPVNGPMIRHWCEAMGDANPAYTDSEFAAQSVHGGIVAPPTMLQAWIMRGLGGPRSEDQVRPPNRLTELLDVLSEAGFSSVVATDSEQEYVRYLKPGDRITATEVIESVSEEKTTALGIGHFVNTRITFRDQNGDVVGTQSFRLLRFKAPQRPSGDAPAMEKPRRLRPVINADNAFFWEAVGRGELLLQQCDACGALRHPPRPMCPECQSLDWRTLPSRRRGVVYSFIVTHHPEIPPFEYPFATAIVQLDEGPKIVSNLTGVDLDKIEIGMSVEVVFAEVEKGLTLPVFQPAR